MIDLHSITVPQDPCELRDNIFSTIATFLACGIDPAKAVIFQQSTVQFGFPSSWLIGINPSVVNCNISLQLQVKQHAELAWLLSCFASSGDLQRMTQWKVRARALLPCCRATLLTCHPAVLPCYRDAAAFV